MKNKTRNIIINAFLVALVFIVTKLINIPTGIGGVINFGDSIILFISTFLALPNAVLVAAIGSAMADFFSPYAIYTPATLIIKGLIVFCSSFLYKKITKNNVSIFIVFVISELIMIVGYFIFEAYILKFGVIVAAYEIINNFIQAISSAFLALLLYNSTKTLIKKININ